MQVRVLNSTIESWEDPNHQAIPSDVYSWCTAFQDIDKDVKRIHANAPKIAYFFPHPSLFVNGESNERRERDFCTWLISQSAWITHLLILDPSPVVPHCWCDFLNTIPATITSTHSGRQLQKLADLFGPEFVRVMQVTASEVQFWDLTLNLNMIGQMDNTTKGKILWDLYKHSFQFEHLVLDWLLVPQLWTNPNNARLGQVCQVSSLALTGINFHFYEVFPSDAELAMCMEPFPMKNQGLISLELEEKHHYVESFHVLLSSWPEFPMELQDLLMLLAVSVCVWVVEKNLA